MRPCISQSNYCQLVPSVCWHFVFASLMIFTESRVFWCASDALKYRSQQCCSLISSALLLLNCAIKLWCGRIRYPLPKVQRLNHLRSQSWNTAAVRSNDGTATAAAAAAKVLLSLGTKSGQFSAGLLLLPEVFLNNLTLSLRRWRANEKAKELLLSKWSWRYESLSECM